MNTLGWIFTIGGLVMLIVGIVLLAIYTPMYINDHENKLALGLLISGAVMLVIGLGMIVFGAYRLFKTRKVSPMINYTMAAQQNPMSGGMQQDY